MGSKIQILSDHTINQIAAGEVIENPASVIKELVENAVDAGARQIYIETTGGGFQSICIKDDGFGMTPEDAVLCLERHATSKIVYSEDLCSLATLGFRGEALASIASIAQVSVVTKAENSEAVKVNVEGGKLLKVEPAARAKGTTIEVRSLFYNVPARKKFQKSASASSAEITKIVSHLALAHPEIGFELIQQHRLIFSLPSVVENEFISLLQLRAQALLPEEFTKEACSLKSAYEEVKIQGWIAPPFSSRHNRSGQYLFINRRPVLCHSIAYAIRDAYGTRLDSDRHPLFLLHLTIDSNAVDVNVHPQKKEVRLKEESLLKFHLHTAVENALCSELPHQEIEDLSFSKVWSFEDKEDFSSCLDSNFLMKEDFSSSHQFELPLQTCMKTFGMLSHYLLVDAATVSVLEKKEGLLFFDIPAVEACVWFEQMSDTSYPTSQKLLIPLTVSFSKAETELLLSEMCFFEKVGIEMHLISETTFLIESIPSFLDEKELTELFHALFIEVQQMEKNKTAQEKKVKNLASCLMRYARNRTYQIEEAVRLVESLFKLKNSFLCPQGKATFYHMREDEIAKKFKAAF